MTWWRPHRWTRQRWLLAGTIAGGAGVVALFVALRLSGPNIPNAPSCGSPQQAHTAAIDADPAVRCLLQAARSCTQKEVVITGAMLDNTVDQHVIVLPSDHCRLDDYVTHYLGGAANTSLDWQCSTFAELPDWGLVLTGCTPPVSCYADLGSPVLDPPATPATSHPNATPAPSASATPAGPGAPATDGVPHC